MEGKISVLDLGCGYFPYEGSENEVVTTVDIRPDVEPDVNHDLFVFPYPFEDNMFDVIHASHIMEHMQDCVKFMEELYRLAKPDAKIIIKVPHYSSGRSAWGDPTHIRAFSSYGFNYFSKERRDHYGDCDFSLVDLKLQHTRFDRGFFVSIIISPFFSMLANLNVKFCEKVWCYWVGGFSEMQVELKAVK